MHTLVSGSLFPDISGQKSMEVDTRVEERKSMASISLHLHHGSQSSRSGS